ncbi:ComEC/Rec2 family competence protein [Echinicola sediminis]
MKFNDYPFLRYVLFFVSGILLHPLVEGGNSFVLAMLIGVSLAVYLFILLLAGQKRVFGPKWCFPALAYPLLILTGWFLADQEDAQSKDNHLMKVGNIQGYLGVVLEADTQKANSVANKVAVKWVKTAKGEVAATGEVIIYHRLDSALQVGELLWIKGAPKEVDPPKNPGEFDYHRYLANKQIYYTHFVGEEVLRLGSSSSFLPNRVVYRARGKISRSLEKYVADAAARQVASALIIGEKQGLEEQVSEAYVQAGTMHILAVSGLHVGMIYGFFFLFFKPYQLTVRKRIAYLSVVVLLIWCYAAITGLSPSVMRAATMFTILSLAQMKSRAPSILNSLALSAMVLMAFNPFIIYEVGFQLSYAAVLGIVLLQPWVAALWLPKNRLLWYFWEISSVSIAAQLATFPITAYYFHVFPNYGLLANLVAIPGAFLVMAIGLPYMVFAVLGVFEQPMAWALEKVVMGLNYVIFKFQELPFAQTEGIYIGFLGMLVFWTGLACLYQLSKEKKKSYAYAFCGLVLLFGVYRVIEDVMDKKKKVVYIYALKKGFAVDCLYQGALYTYSANVGSGDLEFRVQPHQKALGSNGSFFMVGERLGDGNRIFLPNGDVLRLEKGRWDFSQLNQKEVALFEKGRWKKHGDIASLSSIDQAVRIILP